MTPPYWCNCNGSFTASMRVWLDAAVIWLWDWPHREVDVWVASFSHATIANSFFHLWYFTPHLGHQAALCRDSPASNDCAGVNPSPASISPAWHRQRMSPTWIRLGNWTCYLGDISVSSAPPFPDDSPDYETSTAGHCSGCRCGWCFRFHR